MNNQGASDAVSLEGEDSLTVDTENSPLLEESEQDRLEEDELAKRPIFKRPSPWWIYLIIFMVGVAVAATAAPTFDIYTALVCEEIRPELILSLPNTSAESLWTKIPIPSKECRSDPTVQGAVAALATAMEISMAVLSCLTIGYWMQFSDRFGRVKVLLIAEFGLVANQLVILLVSLFPHKLPGGYRFYLFAQIFEGLLGGRVLVAGILSVYVTDTSAPQSRTVNLGVTSGLGLVGNSLGPPFGAFLMKQSDDLLSVYDFAIKVSIVFTLITIFFVPEPLTSTKIKRAQRIYASKHNSSASAGQRLFTVKRVKSCFIRLCDLATTLFESLKVFLPYRRQNAEIESSSKDTRDYGMFLVGCVCFVQTLASNHNRYIFQYMQRVLEWDSRDSSIWLGYNEAASAVYLVIMLPLAIRWLKTKFGTTSLSSSSPTVSASPTRFIKFDYIVLIFSECIAAISMFITCFIYTSAGWYIVSLIRILALGYDSSLKSLALALYARQVGKESESGKLLGALNVLALLSGSIIGPVIFGSLYIQTVKNFPQAIFLAAGILSLIATFLVLRLRIRNTGSTVTN